jgi:hypothetical protein
MDPLSGAVLLPWWAALAIAVLVAVLGVIAVLRGGWPRIVSSLAQSALLLGGLFLAWNYFDRMNTRERIADRHAFDERLADLNARALVPGSPLACLNANAGEAVDEACEKSLFASAESVAAAVAFSAARIGYLREAIARSGQDTSYDGTIAGFRRLLERDRFGFVAQALAAHEGCTVQDCDALALFASRDRIAANLADRTFEIHVSRHVSDWGKPAAALASASANPQTSANGVTTSSANMNFPSAASIPPVSIMNNEPGMSGQTGADADKTATASATANAAAREAKPAAPAATPARRPAQTQTSAQRPAARAAAPQPSASAGHSAGRQ